MTQYHGLGSNSSVRFRFPSLCLSLVSLCLLMVSLCVGACKNTANKNAPSGAPSASATATAGGAGTEAKTPPAPSGSASAGTEEPFYAGPVGTLAGRVKLTGDPPPKMEKLLARIPVGKCLTAHALYQHLFRVQPDGGLADALVAVTEYQGRVQPPSLPLVVEAKDCAYDRRTIAVVKGQPIEVFNRGGETYTPRLSGKRTQALLVAMPGGAPVSLVASEIGLYQLVDHSHEHIFADVFVLSYPTAAVTDTSGHFEIKNIPVGKIKVNALLPVTQATVGKEVVIEANKTTQVELELRFDRKVYDEQLAKAEAEADAKPAPSAPVVVP